MVVPVDLDFTLGRLSIGLHKALPYAILKRL